MISTQTVQTWISAAQQAQFQTKTAPTEILLCHVKVEEDLFAEGYDCVTEANVVIRIDENSDQQQYEVWVVPDGLPEAIVYTNSYELKETVGVALAIAASYSKYIPILYQSGVQQLKERSIDVSAIASSIISILKPGATMQIEEPDESDDQICW